MARIRFSSKVERRGRFLYILLPEKATRRLGTSERVPVEGMINGYPFESAVFPDGDGGHYLMLTREMSEGGSLQPGDKANLIIQADDSAEILEAPPDLAKALERNRAAKQAFDKLSHTHKLQYLEWIMEAKRPETRSRRIEKALTLLGETCLEN